MSWGPWTSGRGWDRPALQVLGREGKDSCSWLHPPPSPKKQRGERHQVVGGAWKPSQFWSCLSLSLSDILGCFLNFLAWVTLPGQSNLSKSCYHLPRFSHHLHYPSSNAATRGEQILEGSFLYSNLVPVKGSRLAYNQRPMADLVQTWLWGRLWEMERMQCLVPK